MQPLIFSTLGDLVKKPQLGQSLNLRFVVTGFDIVERLEGTWLVRLPDNQEMPIDFGSRLNPDTSEIITAANLVLQTWYMAQPKPGGGGPYR